MVRNARKQESRVQRSRLGAFVAIKLRSHFFNESREFNAPGRPALHHFFCNNEMVRNAPKHESRVQRSALGAFIAKTLHSHSVNDVLALNALCGPVFYLFRAVTKWSETHQNMRIGSNEVYWVRSLRKNSIATSLTRDGHSMHYVGPFCIVFRAVTKWSETHQIMSLGSNEVDWVRSLRKNSIGTSLTKDGYQCTRWSRFASSFVQ